VGTSEQNSYQPSLKNTKLRIPGDYEEVNDQSPIVFFHVETVVFIFRDIKNNKRMRLVKVDGEIKFSLIFAYWLYF
jgi:hypothetical protein